MLTLDMGKGCVVQIADPLHGHVGSAMPNHGSYWTDKPPIKTDVDGFGLDFECFDVTPKTTFRFLLMKCMAANTTSRKKNGYCTSSQKEIKKILGDVTRIYQIKTVNADGFARTTDDTIGDPVTQRRKLTYCLLHGSKAICGDTDIMMLEDPQGNLLPYALKILRSIEFVGPPLAPSSAVQPEPSSAKTSTQ